MCVPCVWQWDVDELDSLVREIEAGEATLPARRLLAIALARKGDMPGAETQARAVLASEAADPSMLFLQGLAHEKRDELVEAVDCYAQVLEEEPDAWRAHFHLAKLHLNVGLVAAAAGHLRSTLEVNPDFAPAQEAMDKLSGIDVEALQARFDRGRISPIPPLYLPYISPTSPLQASFDQGLDHSLDPSLDERGDGDGPAAAAPPSAPEPFDVASLGDFFADPEG